VRTIIFQAVTALGVLLFGVIALRTASRRPDEQSGKRAAWMLTGGAFSAAGFMTVMQNVWGFRAFAAGPGSQAWVEYVRWAPAANHARGFLTVAFIGILLVLPLLRGKITRRSVGAVSAVLGGGALLGALAGLLEGEMVGLVHFTAIAASGTFLLALLAAALLLHLARDTMDRILWMSLCVYGFHVAIGSLWHSALAWMGVPDASHPPVWVIAMLDAAAAWAMVGLAGRALVLARRGVYVPALFEEPRPHRFAELPADR
jgi:hypothetical protein